MIELFHQSPTLDKLIPLFINDINSSPNLFQIYYQIAENLTQIVLINNYPVNKVRIVGKIINENINQMIIIILALILERNLVVDKVLMMCFNN